MKSDWGVREFENREQFYEEADWPMFALRDASYSWWLVYVTEDGEWYGVRPPTEDDERSESDPYRPVGPAFLDHVELPWRVIALDDLDPEPTDSEDS